jgi:hypothetical protein
MDIKSLLDRLLQLEIAMRDLYGFLAAVFRDEHDVAALFLRLEAQEERHANLVRYQRRLVAHNPTRFQDVDVDLGGLDAALDSIHAFRNGGDRPPLAAAIDLAKELEGSLAERIHGSVVALANPELAALMTALGGDDQLHRRLLEDLHDRILEERHTA